MILKKVVVGPMQVNCYILAAQSTGEAIIIDPGAEPEKIERLLEKSGLRAGFIVNTHGHIDHIGACAYFSVPVYIHQRDSIFFEDAQMNLSSLLGQPLSVPKRVLMLEDGQRLKLGEVSLEVIHTPGHTPGGICLNAGKFVFTGDTLFAQGIGRTDFPLASESDLINSIRTRLFSLRDDVRIYPGHGPASTIGAERKKSSFPSLWQKERT